MCRGDIVVPGISRSKRCALRRLYTAEGMKMLLARREACRRRPYMRELKRPDGPCRRKPRGCRDESHGSSHHAGDGAMAPPAKMSVLEASATAGCRRRFDGGTPRRDDCRFEMRGIMPAWHHRARPTFTRASAGHMPLTSKSGRRRAALERAPWFRRRRPGRASPRRHQCSP